jgi:hypothetical protein
MKSSASTPADMQCMYCPTGTYEDGTTTMTLERAGMASPVRMTSPIQFRIGNSPLAIRHSQFAINRCR